jgi:hypothetical protein
MTRTKDSPPVGFGGPVSAALETDLRTWVRQHGIAVWLDSKGRYTGFVDRLVAARKAGELPYEVRAFRGSHLALMMQLEGIASGTEKVPVVIHLPEFTEETVKYTPLLELYAAGVRYRKGLTTIVTEAAAGRVRPELIEAFKSAGELTLDGADVWLSSLLDDAEGGIAAQLRAMKPEAVFDDLLGGGFVAGRLTQAEEADVIWERLAIWTGLADAWRTTTVKTSTARAEDVAFAVGSWALCVEYVHDLRERVPVSPHLLGIRGLPKSVVETCRGIAVHLRERHGGFYRRTADATEALLADEAAQARPEDLGKIDTFRFEEIKVLEAALEMLGRSAWDQPAEWAALRLDAKSGKGSFWLREDPTRESAWQLVREAARLGQALVRAGDRLGVGLGDSVELAVEAYVKRGAAVDQAHRQLEQRRVALLYPQVTEFETLRSRLDQMRQLWRRWADAWARDFNTVCKKHGFLPTTAYQQRALFEEVVRPLTQEGGVTAYFVVDALRFEMGEELFRQLDGTAATTVHLKARLAELPTVTEVGMNVLAPAVQAGRLTPVMTGEGRKITGFQTGEFQVSDPATRRRAMHTAVGGSRCEWVTLEQVVGGDSTWLAGKTKRSKLLVVHSQEIDNAGEKGVGPAVFDVVMQKLRAAWRLLRDAGVRRFVFTSDHGFLLLDDSAASAQPHGRKIDPKRRHVFSPIAADHTGEVRVALAELGYDGVTGHVMFPESTAVFDLGRRSMSFVHGGNSLQERVIPVLTVVHRAGAGGDTLEYGITAVAREGVAGMHCLEATVEVIAQRGLDFGSSKEIELAVRVTEADDVQVELCQTRKARLLGGAVIATVGVQFELFFRLSGSTDARVQVELYHPAAVAVVQPGSPEARFAVTASGTAAVSSSESTRTDTTAIAAPKTATASDVQWFDQFTDPGVRKLFAHLTVHGVVTGQEALVMLGGERRVRRFAIEYDELVKKAPFAVRIDMIAGIRRYVREGHE